MSEQKPITTPEKPADTPESIGKRVAALAKSLEGITEAAAVQALAAHEKAKETVDKLTAQLGGAESGKESADKNTKLPSAIEYFKGDNEAMLTHFRKLEELYSQVLAVEHSVVRIDQQNEIFNSLEAGTPVVIEAYKRQGKTSMLKSLGNEWTKKYGVEPLFIDMNKKDYKWNNVSAEEFQNEVGKKEVSNFIEDNFPEISAEEVDKEMEGKSSFQALDALMGKYGKKALLEIDELFQTGKINDGRLETFAESLRNLKNVKVLLAWHPYDKVSAQAETAFKDYKRSPIKPLDFEDAKILIEKPLKDLGSDVSFSDEAIQKIYDYTGGRPIDMNRFCGQLTGDKFKAVQMMRYEKADIDEFINKNNLMDTDIAKDSFRETYAEFPILYEKDLNKEHKDAISSLVKSGGEVQFSDISEKNAQELINLGLIRKDEKNNTYKINGELVFNLLKNEVEKQT